MTLTSVKYYVANINITIIGGHVTLLKKQLLVIDLAQGVYAWKLIWNRESLHGNIFATGNP